MVMVGHEGENSTEKRSAVHLLVEHRLQQRAKELEQEVSRLRLQLNTPEIHDFTKAVVSEAQHQRHRWGAEHDTGKSPADWFWLIGYLAGKALASHLAGNKEKALHHTITVAAACANWHAAISGQNNEMRPGSDPAALGETNAH